MRRSTFTEISWPVDAATLELAAEWSRESSQKFIDWLWRSFEVLLQEAPVLRDPASDFEAFERSLTHHHFILLSQLIARETHGFASFTVQHEMPELEGRKPAPAMPPAYDLAFVWNANPRVAWPVEAKVVPTPRALAPYLSDTRKLTESGAPFCNDAAQLAYVLFVEVEVFLDNLNRNGQVAFLAGQGHCSRPLRTSYHERVNRPGLRIFHLAMALR
jgi:hypothetical protein